MNVLVLIPYMQGWTPGQRSSIELWEKVLEPSGIHLHFVPFETPRLHSFLYRPGQWIGKIEEMVRAYAKRLRLLKNLDSFDCVLVYREAALIGPAFLERLIAKKKIPIIYCLDDPLYIPYVSPFNHGLSYLKCFSKVAGICRMSKAVIVNSSMIKEYAVRYNANVWEIPSLVDTDKYIFHERPAASSPVCIGWTGSLSTVDNLSVVEGALRELKTRVKHRVHLIGGREFRLPGVDYTSQLWNKETEVEDLRQMDVGLIPLPKNEWNDRKFFLKSVQYMALGIPPVASPFGSNREVIRHGETGFLAGTDKEWIDYLELLVRDSSLRLRMAANAARVAEEKYSLKAHRNRIVDAFKSVLK